MTTHATPRPILSWKDLYDRTEAFWSKPLQEMLGSETVVGMMSLTRENALTQQQFSREVLEQHWDTLRLPTKTDHARLAGQVVQLESKVEALEDRLESLDGKLDQILNLLAANNAASQEGTEPEHEVSTAQAEGGKRRSTKS
jgi:hypothetical protein